MALKVARCDDVDAPMDDVDASMDDVDASMDYGSPEGSPTSTLHLPTSTLQPTSNFHSTHLTNCACSVAYLVATKMAGRSGCILVATKMASRSYLAVIAFLLCCTYGDCIGPRRRLLCDRAIRFYFEQGFSNSLILCFFLLPFMVCISQ